MPPATAPKHDFTVAQAQEELPALLERVERGEVIAVRDHGRVIAELRPAGANRLPFGCMASTGRVIGDIVSPLLEDWDE